MDKRERRRLADKGLAKLWEHDPADLQRFVDWLAEWGYHSFELTLKDRWTGEVLRLYPMCRKSDAAKLYAELHKLARWPDHILDQMRMEGVYSADDESIIKPDTSALVVKKHQDRGGRPKGKQGAQSKREKKMQENRARIKKEFGKFNMSPGEFCKLTGVSRSTLYRALRNKP